MGYSPYYPDGVTDEMIEQYFGNNASCATCYYFHNGLCQSREDKLVDDYSIEEIETMDDRQYQNLCGTDEDDYCDDYEYNEDLSRDEEYYYDMYGRIDE